MPGAGILLVAWMMLPESFVFGLTSEQSSVLDQLGNFSFSVLIVLHRVAGIAASRWGGRKTEVYEY